MLFEQYEKIIPPMAPSVNIAITSRVNLILAMIFHLCSSFFLKHFIRLTAFIHVMVRMGTMEILEVGR